VTLPSSYPHGLRCDWTPVEVGFRFGEWKGMRRPNRIARDKGDLPHPDCADYAAERSPNQADQSDPEKKRHCEREQGACPLFFAHI